MIYHEYNGILADLDIEEYHKGPGLSRSALVDFKRSPLHYWHEHINLKDVPSVPTKEMIFGNALHVKVLEPDTFWDRYYSMPGFDRRTKSGKESHEIFSRAAGDKIILHGDTELVLADMHGAILDHPVADKLIENAQYETSIYWTDTETGILCKCRPDIWGHGYIADLKTTMDASHAAFNRDVWKYNYVLQCAMIREGVISATSEHINDFIFIVIEKELPHAIGIYQLSPEALQKGIDEFHELLHRFKECQDKDEWLGYAEGVVG